jgi:hypothetical protein
MSKMVRNHFRNKNYLHVRWGGEFEVLFGFWWFPPCSHCVPNRFPTMLPMYSPSSQCVSFPTPQASNLFLGIRIIRMLKGEFEIFFGFLWFPPCSHCVPKKFSTVLPMYSPSSQCVPNRFPMVLNNAPNVFPTGSQCGSPP